MTRTRSASRFMVFMRPGRHAHNCGRCSNDRHAQPAERVREPEVEIRESMATKTSGRSGRARRPAGDTSDTFFGRGEPLPAGRSRRGAEVAQQVGAGGAEALPTEAVMTAEGPELECRASSAAYASPDGRRGNQSRHLRLLCGGKVSAGRVKSAGMSGTLNATLSMIPPRRRVGCPT